MPAWSAKNALATVAHSVATTCIVTIIWVVLGYSLVFTPATPYLGSLDRLLLHGMVFLKDAGQLTVHHVARQYRKVCS
jgi:Amt family ammonium transporter